MLRLELTLPTAEENLALDEALLDQAEAAGGAAEVLRLWEPSAPMVVLGRSSRVAAEVHETACQQLGIPIFRRASGGAAIITGPGSLMYAVVLSLQSRPALRSIETAHAYVLGRLADCLGPLVPGVRRQGTSDLALADARKFSGNSLRVKRDHVLYHGTLLYDFRCELIERCLAMPPRQPGYRAGRSHRDFVANLPLGRDALSRAVIGGWCAEGVLIDWPEERTRRLAAEKYSRSDWNYHH
ncbi:MAG: lipoate--protein ligase family protein [Pirellulales bacterium]